MIKSEYDIFVEFSQRLIDNTEIRITDGYAQRLLDWLLVQKKENDRLEATIVYLAHQLDLCNAD